MSHQTPMFDWHTTESEEEWVRLVVAPSAHAPARTPSRRLLWEIALMLVVLALAGGRGYLAYSHAQQRKAELQAAAARDLQAEPSANAQAADASAAESSDPSGNSQAYAVVPQASGFDADTLEREAYANHDVIINSFRVQGDSAVVHAMTPTYAYRQTFFYRRTAAGWQAAEPDPALWGAARTLATDTFVFAYQEQDAAVVADVAPQLEALYAQMRANFGLPPAAVPIIIEVSITQAPTDHRLLLEITAPPPPGAASHMPRTRHRILVASPARYRAPAALSDAELLAQSIALPLSLHVVAEALAANAIEPGEHSHLLQALRLWQVWDLDLPLAQWRDEVVAWRLHAFAPLVRGDTASVHHVPQHYSELCAQHRLWLVAPSEIGIPLRCGPADHAALDWMLFPPAPSTQTEALLRPVLRRTQTQAGEQYWIDWSGDVVTLAVLLEFIADGYGREQLTAFVQELAHHTSLNTLILQVFGVSVAEFERAWQAYLAALAPETQ